MVDWTLWPALVAGGVMATTALAFFLLGISNRVHRAFALLLMLWAAHLALPAFGGDADDLPIRLREYVNLAFPFAVVHFAMRYAHGDIDRTTRWRAWGEPAAVSAAAAVPLGLYLADHDLLARASDGAPSVLAPIAAANYLMLATLSLFLLVVAVRLEPGPRRKGLWLVSFAMLLQPIYYLTFFLATFRLQNLVGYGPWDFAQQAVVLAGAVPVVAWFVVAAMHHGASLARAWPVFAAVIASAVPGILLYQRTVAGRIPFQDFQAVQFGFLSLWALTTPVLIGFGIVRYRFMDIELRAKFALTQSMLAALFTGVFIVISEVLEESIGLQNTAASVVAAVSIAAALRPLQHVATRLADRFMPGIADNSVYRMHRAEEVYRAAYESAMLDGTLTDREARILAGLRTQLKLPDDTVARIHTV